MPPEKLLLIPGPSPVVPRILDALALPTVSHVGPDMARDLKEACESLQKIVFSAEGEPFIVAGAGTLAMEMALLNTAGPADRVLVLSQGYFGDRMAQICQAFRIDHDVLECEWGRAVTSRELDQRLKTKNYNIVVCTHVDTATGACAPVEEYSQVLERTGAVFIVDGVCATGGIPERMDAWGIDVVLTAAQKCLGTPPGLAILVFSGRAMEKRRGLKSIPAYYSDILRWLPIMHDPTKYFSTPCVNEIRAFAEAMRIILEEGIEERFERHDLYAQALRAGLGGSRLLLLHGPEFRGLDALRRALSRWRRGQGLPRRPGRERGRRRRRPRTHGGPCLPHGPHGQPDLRPGPVRDRRHREDAGRTGPGRQARRGKQSRRRHPEGMTMGRSRPTSLVYLISAAGTDPADELAAKAKKVYLATGFNERIAEGDFAALKIHFGEAGNTGYIKPAWLAGLIWEVRTRTKHAFLTDSNTLYVGNRSNSIDHLRLAWSHGFTPEATGLPVIIADGLIGRDKQEPRSAQARTASSKIASAILDSDAFIGLTHVTGHVQTGLGAAIKNMGMGCASRAGKLDQHSVTHPRVNAKQCRNCSVCMAFCPGGGHRPSGGPCRHRPGPVHRLRRMPGRLQAWGHQDEVGRGLAAASGEDGRVRLPRPLPFQRQSRLPQFPHPGDQGLRLHGQEPEADRRRHRDPGFGRSGGHRPSHGRPPYRPDRRQ